MRGEKLINVFVPKFDDWFVLQTEKSFYSIRLGGLKKVAPINPDRYTLEITPVINKFGNKSLHG